MAIFVDTGVLCAYINTDDVHHRKSRELMKSIVDGKYGKPILTDYIFDESVTVTHRKAGKLNSELYLAKAERAVFRRGWEIFMSTEALSFTDCTSYATIRSFAERSGAKFGETASRTISRIVAVICPEWSEAE